MFQNYTTAVTKDSSPSVKTRVKFGNNSNSRRTKLRSREALPGADIHYQTSFDVNVREMGDSFNASINNNGQTDGRLSPITSCVISECPGYGTYPG